MCKSALAPGNMSLTVSEGESIGAGGWSHRDAQVQNVIPNVVDPGVSLYDLKEVDKVIRQVNAEAILSTSIQSIMRVTTQGTLSFCLLPK